MKDPARVPKALHAYIIPSEDAHQVSVIYVYIVRNMKIKMILYIHIYKFCVGILFEKIFFISLRKIQFNQKVYCFVFNTSFYLARKSFFLAFQMGWKKTRFLKFVFTLFLKRNIRKII